MNNENLPPRIEGEVDGLALALTIISILTAIASYGFFKKTSYNSTIDAPLIAACIIPALYSILVFLLCSRVKSSHHKIERLETMVEYLITTQQAKDTHEKAALEREAQ